MTWLQLVLKTTSITAKEGDGIVSQPNLPYICNKGERT